VLLTNAINLDDIERAARRQLPRAVFDVIQGGAEDETTVAANRAGFDRFVLRPRPLVDVSQRSLRTTVLGEQIALPVMLAPTGASRIAHRHAELPVARAACAADTIYVQSTVTAYPFEDVARAASRPLWFQLYLPPDRRDVDPLLHRVAAAGYSALVVTIDTPVFGNRERDRRSDILATRVRVPVLMQGLQRPRWAVDYMRGQIGARMPTGGRAKPMSQTSTRKTVLASTFGVTWSDLEHLRERWDGPLVVKGLMRADEARRLIDVGVDGIVVSNHGGRQLDGVAGTIDVLRPIVDAVANDAEVFLDGGIRRGTDVLKALGLGARAVLIGRPYLYGLAAGGEAGVARVLAILRDELDRAMALTGVCDIDDVAHDIVGSRAPADILR
jgi:isopentenyl diphosphate isomerase/L-lactate dehydrogenase-like FMN-dependent dehydrogenase